MKRPEPLTITVFGGHRASRTFLLPPAWVTHLGILLCVMIAITLTSTGLAMRYYRLFLRADPTRVHELERRVEELSVARKPEPAPVPVAPALPPEGPPPAALSKPLATLNSELGLFTGLPSNVKRPQDAANIAIEIGDLKSDWIGKTLDVYFSIRYTHQDSGNQQGRIVILARGPETLMAYPTGVLNPPASASLISPEKGEYFSVSRFREVRAKFGPVFSRDTIQSVEILVFGNQDQLLFHQILKAGEHLNVPETSEPVSEAKPQDKTQLEPQKHPVPPDLPQSPETKENESPPDQGQEPPSKP